MRRARPKNRIGKTARGRGGRRPGNREIHPARRGRRHDRRPLADGTILNTPKGLPSWVRYTHHDRPDWKPGQIFPTSIVSVDDHTIDVTWTAPISYTATKFRVNYAPVDPNIANSSFPWEGAANANHWVEDAAATSTRITGLTGGGEYKLRVQGQYPPAGQSYAWNGPWATL